MATNDPRSKGELQALRKRQEGDLTSMTVPQIRQLVGELQARQTELAQENEALRAERLDLSKARDHYFDLWEFAPVGYLNVDTDGVIVDANSTVATMLRVEHKALLGQQLSRYVDTPSQVALERYHQSIMLRSADNQTSELLMLRSDGSRFFGRLECLLAEGTPRCCRAALTDITALRVVQEELRALNKSLEELVEARTAELGSVNRSLQEEIAGHKKAAEWLRQQQEFNNALIETAPVIILVLDSNGRIVRFNRYLEDLSGWKLEEVKGGDWFDAFLPRDDREELRAIFQNAVSGDRTKAYRNPIVTRTGEERQVEWFDAELTLAGGETFGLLCVGQDVTEKVLAETELKRGEQRLEAIIRTSPDGIVTHDVDGIIDHFNPAAEAMFGYTAAEVVGQSVSMLMPSPDREAHDHYIQDYLQGHVQKMIGKITEVAAQRKDGTTFPVELSVGESTKLGLFTGFIRDVSERKSLQQQLLNIAEEEQLRIGQQLHDDIGQELVSLMLTSDTLADSLQQGGSEQDANARRVVEGITRTLKKVRTMSRGLIPVELSGRELGSQLASLISRLTDMLEIRCEFHQQGDTSDLDAHAATQLYHIAQEALTNAIKHSEADFVQVTLISTPISHSLAISDNGIGMQQDANRVLVSGLTIMQHRAGVLGASLTVASDPLTGTLVNCTLPRTKSSYLALSGL